MPYVQRDETQVVVGVFANKQPGYAEDLLRDNNCLVNRQILYK